MKLLDARRLRPAAALLACLVVASCGDKPELVAKREQQNAEIHKLDGELAILQDKLDHMPADRSDELKKLKEDSSANKAAIANLESEISDLEAQRKALQDKFDEYRHKYVVR
jgi:outer membrane murein-binding lipoprotein Lpp